jgi:hypothetical protein
MPLLQKHYKYKNKRVCGQDNSVENSTEVMADVTCKKCIKVLKHRGKYNNPHYVKFHVPAPSRLSSID